MEQRVLTRLGKDFQVGSEYWNDVTFTGQRISWTQDPPNGGRTLKSAKTRPLMSWRKSQWNETRKKKLHCTPSIYTMYRCASMAASPTIGDVKSLNKLARQIKSQPVKLQYWPFTGPLRILGFPDASNINNDDGSSQRGMIVFLAESRDRSSRD